jgi:hypothetical protein
LSAIFIAAVFAAAYLYLIKSTDTSYRIHRMDGYKLYFYVASYAAIFASISAITLFLIDFSNAPTKLYPGLFDKHGNLDNVRGVKAEDAKVAALVALSFAWAGTLTIVNICYYRFYPGARQSLSLQLTKSNAFERLLMECCVAFEPMCINTKSGKVYVGLVQNFDIESGRLDYIAILPILSGYRSAKRKKLKFTTNYYLHYEDLERAIGDPLQAEMEIEKFRVVIPSAEITSAAKFDINAYKAINESGCVVFDTHAQPPTSSTNSI